MALLSMIPGVDFSSCERAAVACSLSRWILFGVRGRGFVGRCCGSLDDPGVNVCGVAVVGFLLLDSVGGSPDDSGHGVGFALAGFCLAVALDGSAFGLPDGAGRGLCSRFGVVALRSLPDDCGALLSMVPRSGSPAVNGAAVPWWWACSCWIL